MERDTDFKILCDHFSLQDIVIKRILGGKNSVLGHLLLKLLFVGLETMSPSIH